MTQGEFTFLAFALLISMIMLPILKPILKVLPGTMRALRALFSTKIEPSRRLLDAAPPPPRPTTLQGNFADLGRYADPRLAPRRCVLDEDTRCRNMVILGPTGAGKSSWMMATSLASDIAMRGNSVFVFDAEGDVTPQIEMLAASSGRDLLVYPDIGFNPLNLVKTNAQDRARTFNDVLGRVVQAGADAHYYLQRQQLFVRQVVPLYESVYRQPMILRELWELCLSKERRIQLKNDAGVSRFAQDYQQSVGAWSDAEHARYVSGLVNFIDTICAGEYAHFYNQRHAPTIEDTINRQEVCVIREGGDRETEGHLRGLLYMVALQEATKQRSASSHFLALYIDEFHRYLTPAYLPFLVTSRKRRVAQTLAFQTLGQLSDGSTIEYASTIMTNAMTCVIHSGISAKDAEFFADSIGKGQYEFTSTTETPGTTQLPSVRREIAYDYHFHPRDIRYLDPRNVLVLTVRDRGLDVPRLVEKPQPLKIVPGKYVPPHPAPIAPPSVWDERPAQPQTRAGGASSLSHPSNPTLDHAINEVLEKARQEHNDVSRGQSQPKNGQHQPRRGGPRAPKGPKAKRPLQQQDHSADGAGQSDLPADR